MAATSVAASSLLTGASVRVKFTGTVTTAGATPVVTLDDGSGLAVTLPGNLTVDLLSSALPTAEGSAVLASVNGGPLEVLVLIPNNSLVLKWRRADVGAFVTNSDVVTGVQVLYLAPPPVVPAPAHLTA